MYTLLYSSLGMMYTKFTIIIIIIKIINIMIIIFFFNINNEFKRGIWNTITCIYNKINIIQYNNSKLNKNYYYYYKNNLTI